MTGLYWLAFALLMLGASFFLLAGRDASREDKPVPAIAYSTVAAFAYLAAAFLAFSIPAFA